MGSVIKIGNDYYIEFTARGLKYRRNGGQDPEEARRLLDSIEAKIKQGEMNIAAPEIGALKFFDRFLDLSRGRWPKKTLDRFHSAVRHFQDYLAVTLPQEAKLPAVTPGVVENYRMTLEKARDVRERSIKPAVINLTLILLKDVFESAITQGYLNDNPALHVRKTKVLSGVKPRVLSDEEIQMLLSAADERMKAVITVLWKSGITVDELCRLSWDKVDFDANILAIKQTEANNLERNVPMDSGLAVLLKGLREVDQGGAGHVFVGEDNQPFNRERSLSSLMPLARTVQMNSIQLLRALRNTFAVFVLKKDVSLPRLAQLAGFDDVAKVMRYQEYLKTKD